MTKQKETVFKEKVLVGLRALPRTWAEKINQVSIRGTPDILACVNGRFVGLELKTDTGKVDELQKYKLDQIRSARGISLSVSPKFWPDVLEYLTKIANEETFYDPTYVPRHQQR